MVEEMGNGRVRKLKGQVKMILYCFKEDTQWTCKYMKRQSPLLLTEEMQI